MYFQYLSDLHLEFYNDISHIKIIPEAPNLILAGDIGKPGTQIYKDFIEFVATKFERVFLITGNHEYYGKSNMDEIEDYIRNVICTSYQNVIFLQNECYMIPNTNLALFGGTMWSHIPYQYFYDVIRFMNDYKRIPHLSISKSNELHKKFVATLELLLKTLDDDTKLIVVSHHMPSYDLIDEKYKNNYMNINCAFATNVDIARNPKIIAWIYGHTHTASQVDKFYCNPYGYPGENKNIESKVFYASNVP